MAIIRLGAACVWYLLVSRILSSACVFAWVLAKEAVKSEAFWTAYILMMYPAIMLVAWFAEKL